MRRLPVWLVLAAVGFGLPGCRASAPARSPDPRPSTLTSLPLISPDGRSIAVSETRPGEGSHIQVRDLETGTSRRLPGTEDGQPLAWSPDSTALVFGAKGWLRKATLAGDSAASIAPSTLTRQAAWHPGGWLLFSPASRGPLYRVPVTGGEPAAATSLEPDEFGHGFPQWLPGGERFLMLAVRSHSSANTIDLVDAVSGRRQALLRNPSAAAYVEPAAGQGYLLYTRGQALFARPFDARSGKLGGDPTLIADDLRSEGIVRSFSASLEGAVVYLGAPQWRLRWFNRAGLAIGDLPASLAGRNPALSPDQSRLIVERTDPVREVNRLWLAELDTGAARPLTPGDSPQTGAVWSPDGASVAFAVPEGKGRGIYLAPGDGGPARLLLEETAFAVESWARDTLLYCGQRLSLRLLPLVEPLVPERVEPTASRSCQASLSPDGRYAAYAANDTGRFEIYVRRLGAATPQRWRVSKAGGAQPRWSRDGRELFFLSARGELTRVAVPGGDRWDPGDPEPLFRAPVSGLRESRNEYEVAADGQRFLLRVPVDDPAAQGLRILRDWAPLTAAQ